MPDPVVVSEQYPAPDWIDDTATKEWQRLAPLLVRAGVLTEMDLDALTAYCVAWCTWKDATQKIRAFGMVIKTKTGYPIQSPYIPIANTAMTTMKGLMTEFGMTPSSRNRVDKVETAAANPLDRFTKSRA